MGYEHFESLQFKEQTPNSVSHFVGNLTHYFRLVSDFFCPNTGGIETHIYHLGGCLLKLGHDVIVITQTYGERRGIRYLSNGIKVTHPRRMNLFNLGLSSSVLLFAVGYHSAISSGFIVLVSQNLSFRADRYRSRTFGKACFILDVSLISDLFLHSTRSNVAGDVHGNSNSLHRSFPSGVCRLLCHPYQQVTNAIFTYKCAEGHLCFTCQVTYLTGYEESFSV